MYVELLKTEKKSEKIISPEKSIKEEIITEKDEQPEDILRNAGIKIKLVTATSFGSQIDFAKQYDQEMIKELLQGFNVKFKNKSIFIVK